VDTIGWGVVDWTTAPVAVTVNPASAPAPLSAMPLAASDQSTVISNQLTTTMDDELPVISEGSVISDQLTTTAEGNGDVLAPVVDLLVESLSAGEYVSDSEPVLADGGLLAATGEYDLRPLGDELSTTGEGDDLLADILAESALVSIR
jgi:hypothetical protein